MTLLFQRTRESQDPADTALDPGLFNLAQGEVHIWSIDVHHLAMHGEWDDLLTEGELRRASRFHFHKDRHVFVACRGALCILLAAYLGAEPRNLEFCFS